MDHLELLHNAKVAVEALISDTSVEKQATADSIEELLGMLEPALEALEEEIKDKV